MVKCGSSKFNNGTLLFALEIISAFSALCKTPIDCICTCLMYVTHRICCMNFALYLPLPCLLLEFFLLCDFLSQPHEDLTLYSRRFYLTPDPPWHLSWNTILYISDFPLLELSTSHIRDGLQTWTARRRRYQDHFLNHGRRKHEKHIIAFTYNTSAVEVETGGLLGLTGQEA